MRILFIGGTGRLSKDVAKYALEQGNEVYLLTRGSSNRQRYVEQGYHMLYADIRDVAQSKICIEKLNFDVVIDFLSFHVEDVEKTLEIIRGKFQQYIFISSATVYDVKEGEVISESTTQVGNEKWSYAFSKYQCEQYIEKYFADKQNQYYTIVRPYVTYGNTRVPYPLVPRDSLKEWTLVDRIMRGKAIPVLDMEPIHTTVLHTRDFAVGLVGLCLNEKAYGEAFHITNNTTTTWETILDIIGTIVDRKIHKVVVSKEQIYEYMPEYIGVLEGDKTREMRFDNSKLFSTVPEYNPSVSLKAGLEEMVSFYLDNPEIQLLDKKWDWCIEQICDGEKIGEKSGIVIYGAGEYGKRLYRFLSRSGFCVDYFCQTECGEAEWVYGIPVISKKELLRLDDIKIILIAVSNKDISLMLYEMLEKEMSKETMILQMGEFLSINAEQLD